MITIVDYDAGNLTSVSRALKEIGQEGIITSDPEKIKNADKVIFPGVGAAGQAMNSLHKKGLDEALFSVSKQGKPILGICIGCQIILDKSEENDTDCLGIIPGDVIKFPPTEGLKVPHMGWNSVKKIKNSILFEGIPDNSHFYFVHSYYPKPQDEENILATTDYGITFPSVIARENVMAVQFHTEKSGPIGLQLLKNFLTLA